MNPLGILFHVESLKVELGTVGQDIRLRAPRGLVTEGLRELIRGHKVDLFKMLRARERFGYQGAALFPLIDRKVITRQGLGTLLSVFEQHCRVALELDGAPVVFYRSTDLISAAVDESAEKLAA